MSKSREVLGHLVGDWALSGVMERPGGDGLTVDGTVHGRWILDGAVLQLDQHDAWGRHVARVHFAFDCSRQDFVAFSVAHGATHFEHERGAFDAGRNVLTFLGDELLPDGRSLVYARTVLIVENGFAQSITYPGAPAGRYGEVHLRCRRLTAMTSADGT